MDIEDALTWAMVEELPKRREDDGHGAMGFKSISPMFAGADLGVRVENFNREPGMPLALGDVHPDAILIEQAVHALIEHESHDYGAGLGAAAGLDRLPGVDEAEAFRRAGSQMRLLVVVCAKLRRRPVLDDGGVTAGPKLLGNGKPAVVREEVQFQNTVAGKQIALTVDAPTHPLRAGNYRDGANCPVQYDPTPQSIVLERAEYAVWHRALEILAEALCGKLESIAVLPPSAAARPWTGEQDAGKPPRLFDDHRSRRTATRLQQEAARQLGARRVSRPPMRRGSNSPVRYPLRETGLRNTA